MKQPSVHLLCVNPINQLKGIRSPVCTNLDWKQNRTTQNTDQKEKRVTNEQDWASSLERNAVEDCICSFL
ncbi:hypothetical protein BLNAU_260 [Blattamonas nauphoetae]|uniref:Uncharacterized protein n=1 Tax=Blattamonas nauphoetae TaxID=2049346 RepID=A0ABQ9YMH6_9EUKA|nr:hypothetical protein BLNAU_260 [Blattamonas nauphoetae]